jgi:hypothetical protein
VKFRPEKFLNEGMEKWGLVKWLDLCCGEANALLQYAGALTSRDMQHRAFMAGIDLVGHFQPIPFASA